MAYEEVLIVDENTEDRLLLTRVLEKAGFHPTATFDPEEAITLLRRGEYEVVILDILRSQGDGHALCRNIRQFSNVPIVVVTALNDVYHEVVSLEMGVDDYLVKPCPAEKLISRVRALIRRVHNSFRPTAPPPLTIGPLHLDLTTQKSTLKAQNFPLSGKELLLLYSLAQHLGTPVSRQKLIHLVWSGEISMKSKTLDVHICRLRKKLEEAAHLGHLLITVRKRGYMLSAALEEA